MTKQMLIAGLLIGTLLALCGCMVDEINNSNSDMPWSEPASWEATGALPSSFRDQFQ